MAATYLDASAIVKLVLTEAESVALRRYLRRRQPLVSSALARTEVPRALLRQGLERTAQVRQVFGIIELFRVNDRVLNEAAMIPPVHLGSLDAIHLATARDLGDDLGTIVTYDERMADAARQLGHKVASPS